MYVYLSQLVSIIQTLLTGICCVRYKSFYKLINGWTTIGNLAAGRAVVEPIMRS